ncbi:protein-L-isoaspartate(D-aspartate) O-methyltransferase [Henriciella barbarensis]|uniref:Protein-L-isoaspartate O-methyltransferase n=1 Tax=Henriciella barbarensis TaxID=86342 RepID=A0A399QW41_9PROT|nr:protein-L-isoaspartate(D-aspartate) O-methyltransferase [Henriciella barbarensis]RIJ23306.1 protein-L-isoaspartate(D-aspartate) O-methyltransferase [Henriciella barbarensis]
MKRSRTKAQIERLFASERQRMVRRQIKARGIRDKALLRAMKEVPRELFVPENLREFSYDDAPLPIGEAQTISQPYMAALMIRAAGLTATSRVLEIGAGSGYCVAIMSRLAAKVFAIERNEALARELPRRLAELNCENIEIRSGDGSAGWVEKAPFDAIIVSAVAPRIAQPLLSQLAQGGRLIVPVAGRHDEQRLLQITRSGEDDFSEEDLGRVQFVPLVGEEAFAPSG